MKDDQKCSKFCWGRSGLPAMIGDNNKSNSEIPIRSAW